MVGVKPGAGSGAENEVDMITGATISSRTVIAIINHRVEALQPLLDAHAAAAQAGAPSPPAGVPSLAEEVRP